jgi:SSS family solute:Na+ symporter
VVEDPFGAGTCLILVGLFFAAKLYKLNLLTIGDYYRAALRQGHRSVLLGGDHPQLPGLGGGADHRARPGVLGADEWRDGAETTGMIVGTLAVLIYVVVGGFLAVAITDFIQMIVLVVGMSIIAFFAADLAGGADKVLDMAQQKDLWNFLPPAEFTDIALLRRRGRDDDVRQHPAAGRVPARDVGQGRAHRAHRRRDRRRQLHPVRLRADVHRRRAVVVMGDEAMDMAKNDYQRLLPTFVMTRCRW